MRSLLERFSRILVLGVLGLGILLALAIVVGLIALIVSVTLGAHAR